MLQVKSSLNLDAIEPALRHAAQKRGASVVSVMRLSHLIHDKGPGPSKDAMVFLLCHPELSTALLVGDLRLAAALPCRIAAYEEGGVVTLVAQPPSEFAKALGRPDMETLLLLVDATLKEIMDEASRPAPAAAAAEHARHQDVGATEEQVDLRGSIPQRIDCKGTKVEELAGTGKHDAPGG